MCKSIKRYYSVVIVWACFSFLNGCTSEIELSNPIPFKIESFGESNYTESAQASITKKFQVIVLSKDAQPVPNVTVFFSLKVGSAVLSDSVILTNGEGIATVDVTTGPQAQTIQVEAFVPGLENPSLFFLLHIVSQMPAKILLVSGDQQEAAPQVPLNEYLMVKVVDEFDNPVKDVSVHFSIKSGNGSIDTGVSQFKTDQDGVAYATHITGTLPLGIIEASVGNGSVTFEFNVFTLVPVTLNTVISTQYSTNLSWTKTVNTTFSQYGIFRSSVNSGYFTQIGSVNNPDVTEFADESGELGMAYVYYIRVITSKGNYINSNEKTGERGGVIDLKNESNIADIIISKDKSTIYVARRLTMDVLIITTDQFKKVDSINLQVAPQTLAVNTNGSKLYVGLYGLPQFKVIDLTTNSLIKEIDLSSVLASDAIYDIYVANNGQLFVSSYNGYVTKIDESDDYSVKRIASNRSFFSAAPTFVADYGNFLYMEESLLTPNSLFKIDMSATDAPIILEDDHGTVYGTRGSALSADGEVLYLTSRQLVSTNTIKPIDELNGSQLFSLEILDQKLYGCFYGGAFERWQLDRINLSTQVVEKSIPIGFKVEKLFVAADQNSIYVVASPFAPYYTVRIYKVSISD
jgi:hypothetical protein